MNTIIVHRSIPRPCTPRDKHIEGLLEFVDVLCAPVWEYGYKRDPWWVVEGAPSTGLQTIVEEVVTEVIEESDSDDKTVVEVEEDDVYVGEFPLGEIDVNEQFDWVEQMMLEESEYEQEMDNGDVSVSVYSQDSFVEYGQEMDYDMSVSVYSQDSFVACEQESTEEEQDESPVDARPTGENLLKLFGLLKRTAQIGKERRGSRKATQN